MTTLPGKVVREIVGADLPPEPPVGTAVIDANGNFYQRVKWSRFHGIPVSHVNWAGVGERSGYRRPTWTELLDRGPVTIVWRPAEPEGEQ